MLFVHPKAPGLSLASVLVTLLVLAGLSPTVGGFAMHADVCLGPSQPASWCIDLGP